MQENFDLSHRETQTDLPGPLDEVSFWNRIGTIALPASALSVASGFVFVVTLLFLIRSQELRSLFVLPKGAGRTLAVLAVALAWLVVFLCRRRPGRRGPRIWAFLLAVLNSVVAILLFTSPTATPANALTVAGFAAAFTLLARLVPLRPNSGMIPRITPMTVLLVLLLVLPAVAVTGGSIAASKRSRVDRAIEQLREWASYVQAVAGRDWYGATWDDSAKAVDRLAEIRPAEQLDLSLWREAATLGKDNELAAEAGNLLAATLDGLAQDRVPRVSKLREPAAYNDGRNWRESTGFPQASATIGRYFQEMGRIFAELDAQDIFTESQGLAETKKRYLETESSLAKNLGAQMGEWTDHWAVFRVPEELVGQSEVPLSKLLRNPSPILGKAAADLPGLLWLSYRRLAQQAPPGCKPLGPYDKIEDGMKYEYYRLDCYSYLPRAQDTGAVVRVEMRMVYRSFAGRGLEGSQLPAEVYYFFPLPEDQDADKFQDRVMTDLAHAVDDSTEWEVKSNNQTGTWVNGFLVRREGRKVVVRKPRLLPWIEGREGLEVRAERDS